MRWLMVTVLVVLASACAVPTPTATPAPTPTPTIAPVAPSSSGDESDALRNLAFAYWQAFNAYDADKALSYLEAAYRAAREADIRGDIGRIKTFGVKLGVSEASPPQTTDRGEAEMYLNMKEPLGTRRIRMAFRHVEGDWKITFAEEVK